MSCLEVKNVSKSFSGIKAVQNVSLKAERGKIVSMIGPNGAGKTTTFNLITGIYPIDGGEITLDGVSLVGKPQHAISLMGVGRTFQNIRLFQGMSVIQNVMTGYDPRLTYNLFDGMLCTPRRRRMDRESLERSMAALEIAGIADYAQENPSKLPYGLQRKLEIARALVTQPKLVLPEEPGAALPPAAVTARIRPHRRLQEPRDRAILMIDHRMKLIMELSEYIYVLNFGTMLAEGTPAQIQQNDEVNRAYMGEEG